MISVYLETSAANYFLNSLNGMGAEATRKLQLSKGREWYISTTVLWEIFQIQNYKDMDASMYLASYLFSQNLLKSAAEIIIDYIEQGEPECLIIESSFTKSSIGDHWKKSCNDKGYTFHFEGECFKYSTKFVKDIARYLSIIATKDNVKNNPLKDELLALKEFINAIYNQYYKDDVDELVRKLRTVAILVLFIQLCLALDITKDAIDKYWGKKRIFDPIERLTYLLEKHPDLVRKGPVWNISNMFLSQCLKNRRSSRGAYHDGIHAIYLPFIDVFLTQDDHFREIRALSKKEFKGLYNKIQHLDEFEILRIDPSDA